MATKAPAPKMPRFKSPARELAGKQGAVNRNAVKRDKLAMKQARAMSKRC